MRKTLVTILLATSLVGCKSVPKNYDEAMESCSYKPKWEEYSKEIDPNREVEPNHFYWEDYATR